MNARNCRKCGLPKHRQNAGGSITQWISTCNCDKEPNPSKGDRLTLCPSCGKRFDAGRSGSLTQWVFRSDVCSCNRPQNVEIGSKGPRQRSTGRSDQTPHAPEEELQLDPATFPTDRYKPLAVIGQGAAGVIYLCRDRLLRKKVAVKCLKSINSEQLVDFQREAKATSQLTHEGIVKVLDFGIAQSGAPYMVMEYVRGVSLEQRIRESGPLPLSEALRLFANVASALSYAHEKGIFHRDIKTSNIVVTEDTKDVRIIDFGVALFANQDAQQSTVVGGRTIVGTPAYMPPDQANGLEYDARSELYSLGCVLFESLSGQTPFAGATALEVLSKHACASAPTLSSLTDCDFPSSVESLLAKCLEKDPDDRFQSMNEFQLTLKDIEQSIIEEPRWSAPPVAPLSPPAPTRRMTARKKVALAIGSICAMLVVGVTLVSPILRKPILTTLPAKMEVDERKRSTGQWINALSDQEKSYEAQKYNNLAWKQLKDGKIAQGLKNATTAVSLDQNDLDVLETRGVANFLSGNSEAALVDLSTVIGQAQPGSTASSGALFHRAIVYNSMGAEQKAKADVQRMAKNTLPYRPEPWEKQRFARWLKNVWSPFKLYSKPEFRRVSIDGAEPNDFARLGDYPDTQILHITSSKITATGLKFVLALPLRSLTINHCAFPEIDFVHLKKLQRLESLDLDQMPSFTGRILGQLSELPIRSLKLSRVGITEDAIASLNGWKNLRSLWISDCPKFRGTEFDELNALPIQYLNLDTCAINDNSVMKLSEWRKLKILTIRECTNFDGTSMQHLSQTPLESFSVERSGIKDSALSGITRLKKLKSLTITSCPNFTGTGLAQLRNLPIETVELIDTPLNEKAFAGLATISSIRQINLFSPFDESLGWFNTVAESVHPPVVHKMQYPVSAIQHLSNLPLLAELCIDCDAIDPQAFRFVGKLKSLKRLHIKGVQRIPKEFVAGFSIIPLHSLTVFNTCIDEYGWQAIARSKSLQKLYIFDNGLKENDLEEISRLNLTELAISGSNISDSGILPLANLKTLKKFRFSNFTKLSARGLAQLRQELPNCDIKYIQSMTSFSLELEEAEKQYRQNQKNHKKSRQPRHRTEPAAMYVDYSLKKG